jgi:protein involved in polysaccharide export with SLBB domain
MTRSPSTYRPVLAAILLALFSATAALPFDTPPAEEAYVEAGFETPTATTLGEAALQGPVDGDTYLVGPGDRFLITIWGQGVASYRATVTPEGELVLAGIATVPAAGKSLSEVKAEVESSLDELYLDVEVSVSLVGLRRMLVNVLGRVAVPGVYEGTALDLAGELVRLAGGLREGASDRNIIITRRSGETRRVDLVRYGNAGDVSANPPILDGDVIFVPHATGLVYVYGAVAVPGEYEFVEGETVGDLIDVAGGFTRGAVRDSVELREFVDDVTTVSSIVDASTRPGRSTVLTDGDQVYVREINEWRRVTSVDVRGEVERPGPYGIEEGTDRLSDVIGRAGGPTDEASLRSASLIRPGPEGETDEEFERLKTIQVGEMTEMEYAYFKMRMRDRAAVVVDFEKALSGDPCEDVPLLGGDMIIVPKRVATVDVVGQVVDPGEVEHVPGKRFRYYIRQAGGYASDARANRVKVIKSGTSSRLAANRVGTLEPGDVIWVPERVETDWWKLVREAAGLLTSVITAYVVIDQATGD